MHTKDQERKSLAPRWDITTTSVPGHNCSLSEFHWSKGGREQTVYTGTHLRCIRFWEAGHAVVQSHFRGGLGIARTENDRNDSRGTCTNTAHTCRATTAFKGRVAVPTRDPEPITRDWERIDNRKQLSPIMRARRVKMKGGHLVKHGHFDLCGAVELLHLYGQSSTHFDAKNKHISSELKEGTQRGVTPRNSLHPNLTR